MSGHEIAVQVFKVVTILTTLMMRVSLLPDWNRWRRNKSTGDMSVLPSVMIFGNSYGSLFYAIAIDNMLPLFATSVLGIVVGIILACYFYHWSPSQRSVMKVFIWTFVVCTITTTYSILALVGKTGQSKSSVSTTLGLMMNAATTCMYASPMATIVRVVRTKTSTSMPFTMGVINVLNSFCWGVYGYLINNVFLLVPNIIGVTLSGTQMVVTYIYRVKPSSTTEGVPDQSELVVVIASPTQDGCCDATNDRKHYCKSPSFVALRSPSRDELKRSSRYE